MAQIAKALEEHYIFCMVSFSQLWNDSDNLYLLRNIYLDQPVLAQKYPKSFTLHEADFREFREVNRFQLVNFNRFNVILFIYIK